MAGYITSPAKVVNKALVEFLPELDSEYARYPMKHVRWYEFNEIGPNGEPCFLQADSGITAANAPLKKDYAFCPQGPGGAGYYSLMCRNSYINLYYKVDSCAPQSAACPCFNSKEVREALDRHDDCKRVVYMRQKCFPRPDDKLADDIVMGTAKVTASAVYNATQNEQLVFNAISAAI